MSQSKSKTKRLWQIFFDDEQNDGEDATTSDVRRVATSLKRKITKRVDKTLPKASGRHGVLYEGLMDNESDSDDEVNQVVNGSGGHVRMSARYDPDDPPDLDLGGGNQPAATRETVLFEKDATQNGTGPAGKPYNSREWEAITLEDASRRSRRQPVPQQGARFIIRSESDLELAIPSGKRRRRCCCCACCTEECIQKYSHNYACIVLVGVVITAAYVAIILAIVYGLK